MQHLLRTNPLIQWSPIFMAWWLGWGGELSCVNGRPVRTHMQSLCKWWAKMHGCSSTCTSSGPAQMRAIACQHTTCVLASHSYGRILNQPQPVLSCGPEAGDPYLNILPILALTPNTAILCLVASGKCMR